MRHAQQLLIVRTLAVLTELGVLQGMTYPFDAPCRDVHEPGQGLQEAQFEHKHSALIIIKLPDQAVAST
jgi:hypothetical protein